ncbi:MAG: hypothetical protein AAF410_02200 [Pseudomonadota bacterium]
MIRIPRIVSILVFLSIIQLTACNDLNTRKVSIAKFAEQNQFNEKFYSTSLFTVASYQKVNELDKQVTIYIEGDGKSWINKRRVSNDPTPENPIALKLAANDESSSIIYLARPCQYMNLEREKYCSPIYWTTKRASREIIDSYHEIFEQIKMKTNIKTIRLVGYSGGGTITAILAAERSDIFDLRTVAGNLDIDMFTKIHQVSPLASSINPIELANKLYNVPQIHFYSSNDKIIPLSIIKNYQTIVTKVEPGLDCISIIDVKNASHEFGWVEEWHELHRLENQCVTIQD